MMTAPSASPTPIASTWEPGCPVLVFAARDPAIPGQVASVLVTTMVVTSLLPIGLTAKTCEPITHARRKVSTRRIGWSEGTQDRPDRRDAEGHDPTRQQYPRRHPRQPLRVAAADDAAADDRANDEAE